MISATARPGTFETVLAATRGLGPGFDSCRLALATLIVVVHALQLTNTQAAIAARWFEAREILVPAFFALSGFLVWGSFLRIRDLTQFMAFRVLRILPALFVEVALSALALGPLTTRPPLRDYVADPQFPAYFSNVLGVIRYQLPGVFSANPQQIVNGSLFTVPSEMACYLTLAALIYMNIAQKKYLMLGAFVLIEVAMALFYGVSGRDLHAIDYKQFILDFYAGALLYAFRDRVLRGFFLALRGAALPEPAQPPVSARKGAGRCGAGRAL